MKSYWLIALAVLLVGSSVASNDARAQGLSEEQAITAKTGSLDAIADQFKQYPQVQLSHHRFGTTPNGKRHFIGEFGAEYVALVLRELPKHQLIEIRFDLIVIGSWDGSNTTYGPDFWNMGVVGGPQLIHTTFNNCDPIGTHQQSYPDNFPLGPYESRTGSSESFSLGFERSIMGSRLGSTVYPVRVVVPHTSDEFAMYWSGQFSDRNDEAPGENSNNSWAITNLDIRVDNRPTLTEEQLSKLWTQLGSQDPVQGNEALWDLVATGDQATAWIGESLQRANQEPANEKSSRSTKQPTLSSRKLHRTHHLLQVIGTQRARELKWQMDRPGGPYALQPESIENYEMFD
ncbi:hypothetical protein [Aeoliella mucimassa]|uniref:Uncharacterized protein n=1 Tax=Aeoliella mucimassa TaxID=2527972 RepID=A0A518ASV1_9BACT|nr:hypothetical protein [Aeoliella mucimassa]QDU57800.1 hypothetical protein Pan181_40230 [Aeoliella mucimassa]